jgi:hypothetical protein
MQNHNGRIPSPQFSHLDLIYVICLKLTEILPQFLDPRGIENAQRELERAMPDEPGSQAVLALINRIWEEVNLMHAKLEH